MIKINQFQVTPDNKLLLIDFAIDDREYFSKRYISSINVQAYYPASGSDSGNPYVEDYTQGKVTKTSVINLVDPDTTLRSYTATIDISTDPYALYYLYVEEAGSLTIPEGQDLPCGLKGTSTIAVAYNGYIFYKQGLNYLKGLEGCTPNRYFRDFMMLKRAFELALALGHHQKAYELWCNFFMPSTDKSTTTISTCGCHA